MLRETVSCFVVALCLFALVGACANSDPTPINYGQDSCDLCRMNIVDRRYGSELVTRQGKVYRFDAIECLAGFIIEETVAPEDFGTIWVTHYGAPGDLADGKIAAYLISPELRSPMGMNLTAFANLANVTSAQKQYGGEIFGWDETLELVRAKRYSQ